jgi:valyl-tRNA synthetase
VQVINEYAKMMVGGENLIGKKVGDARETIVQWLRDEGLMEKEEDVNQNVSTAERTGAIIEPLPKLQWFINVNKPIASHNGKSLKELMLAPVREGKINIMPEHFERVYFHWVENLRDWCISRQIWYGHRIPVWYKGDEIFAGVEAPEGDGWTQDEDSLDTWFSSGLWTFSTLGWPNKDAADFKTYHPTTVLETGYDILPFWVARMILMSTYLLNEIPFKTVYFHGLVRDEKGRKMSKSLGNIVDPLTLIDKHGTDALRMAMIVGVGPGNDSNLGEDKIKAYSKFANKLWNITRFVLENTQGVDYAALPEMDTEDAATYAEFEALLKEITKEMDEYKFYLVAEKLYHYAWHTFADVIIERSKNKITENSSTSAQALLAKTLPTLLRALHPFMPFVTEELWSLIPASEGRMLMVEKWPC